MTAKVFTLYQMLTGSLFFFLCLFSPVVAHFWPLNRHRICSVILADGEASLVDDRIQCNICKRSFFPKVLVKKQTTSCSFLTFLNTKTNKQNKTMCNTVLRGQYFNRRHFKCLFGGGVDHALWLTRLADSIYHINSQLTGYQLFVQ